MEKEILVQPAKAIPELAGVGRGAKHEVASALAANTQIPAFSSRRSRNFFGNRYIYAVISQRAGGLSIGINLNPDKFCNFDCVYCEVDRAHRSAEPTVNVGVMAEELQQMLERANARKMRELPGYQAVPNELLDLKEVALSGDGEPTLCPNFCDVVEAIVHIRARRMFPFFKLVLITNSTGLHLTQVQEGLKFFTPKDEVWAKLDAGTQSYFERINHPNNSVLNCPHVSLETVLENILELARQRPVVIQSLFPLIDGKGPTSDEIEAYVQQLRSLKEQAAQISLVQVYSAHRPAINPQCGHLPLRALSEIARRIREVTGLKAEVF